MRWKKDANAQTFLQKGGAWKVLTTKKHDDDWWPNEIGKASRRARPLDGEMNLWATGGWRNFTFSQ
jgi:hypothetical protein